MSGPLLIGVGPWPGGSARHVGFAQLRTAHFHEALASTGLPVRVVCLEAGPERAEQHPEVGPPRLHLDPAHPDTLTRLRELARAASSVVTAGPYAPGRLGALAAGDRPLWADLPGDPFAELQAQSLHGVLPEARVAEALAHALVVLDGADALSVVSGRQRLAALGQLGVRGRLLGPEAVGSVHTIPIAWSFPTSARPPRPRGPEAPLRVVCMGALNAWFDEGTLMEGLELALQGDERVEVDLCGGPHPAHPEAAWRRLEAWARTHPGRVRLHGWLDQPDLDAVLAHGHVGLCLDRPGVEPLLGSRTRVLGFLHAGLDVVATRGTELVDRLGRERFLRAIPPQDAAALAHELLALADDARDGRQVLRAQEVLAERYAPLAISKSLAAWVREPVRLPRGPSPEARLEEAAEHARSELKRLLQSPSFRALNRAHRLLRRIGGAGSGLH